MNKKKKEKISRIVSILIIVGLVFIGILIINYKKNGPNDLESLEETAKCIGNRSTLYIQLGCHACEIQEEKFGDSFKYLNVIDCYKQENRQECIDKPIRATPTWFIKGEEYLGVQSIDKLKELTNCKNG